MGLGLSRRASGGGVSSDTGDSYGKISQLVAEGFVGPCCGLVRSFAARWGGRHAGGKTAALAIRRLPLLSASALAIAQ